MKEFSVVHVEVFKFYIHLCGSRVHVNVLCVLLT
jgi:hypothetical protein